jgi:radical SAM superfamily enzyme YgiQ (UPF0313 family)
LLAGDTEAERANFNYNVPIGLAYISAVLKNDNHSVMFLNLNHLDGTVDELIKNEIANNNYQIVITGGLSPFFPQVKTVVESVRRHAGNVKIILGGGLISSQPEIMFRLLEPDFGVIGEGEETIIELLDCIKNNNDPGTVDGIIYHDSENAVKITNTRKPIKDLDQLPWPDYDGMGFLEYLDHMRPSDNLFLDVVDNPRGYVMVSSRSCPFLCTFCYHPIGNKYRQRSVRNIIEEIKYSVKKYNVNIIIFYDELLTQDKNRLSELCRNIKEFSSTLPFKLKWMCQMRVDGLDENIVQEMKDAGCYFFSLGLESYSATVLKSMKKKITPEQIDNALRICKRAGMAVQGNFIFGDLAETKETYQETLNYWKNNQDLIRGSVSLMHIILYQGSYIYKNAVERGIIKDEVQFIEERAKEDFPAPINFTVGMTDEEYQQMINDLIEAYGIPRYYTNLISNIQTDDRYEIKVCCPFCKEILEYKNYHYPPNFTRIEITCRKCGSRFVIPGKGLKLKIFIVKLFGYKIPYRFGKWIYYLSDHLPNYLKIKIKKALAQ